MQKPPVVHISNQNLDELLAKFENPSASPPTADDYKLAIEFIKGYANIFERTQCGDMSLKTLRALLGIAAPKSNGGGGGNGGGGKNNGNDDDGDDDGGDDENDEPDGGGNGGSGDQSTAGTSTGTSTDQQSTATKQPESDFFGPPAPEEPHGPWPRNRDEHGRRGPDDFPNAPIISCRHDELKIGDVCPKCLQGKLLAHLPSFFVAIDAESPFQAMNISVERLVCAFCKAVFSAPLPAKLEENGCNGHRLYSYRAVAQIGINKYFGGMPFYRTESIEEMSGFRIPDSSQLDQCEFLADCGLPVVKALYLKGAGVGLAFVDDTHGEILTVPSKIVDHRVTGKKTERDGCHTSLFIGVTDEGREIYIYKTGILHSGEMIDLVFKPRPAGLPQPMVMADGASCNYPTVIECHMLCCLAHLTRKFKDALESGFKKLAREALHLLGVAFTNDKVAREKGMTKLERLAFHREMSRPAFKELVGIAAQAEKARLYEPSDAITAGYRYLLNNEYALSGFCRWPGAPLTNNAAERGFQKIMHVRNNVPHFKNVVGSGIADVLWTIGVTALAAKENLRDYFVALQRFRHHVKEAPEKWFPWSYRETMKTIDVEVTRRSSKPLDDSPLIHPPWLV